MLQTRRRRNADKKRQARLEKLAKKLGKDDAKAQSRPRQDAATTT
jgi:hypothetical protein